MQQQFEAINRNDIYGNPAGGSVYLEAPVGSEEPALYVRWQDGPLAADGVRTEPNGAFVETVIAAAAQRIRYYQESKFACVENDVALSHLEAALAALQARTAKRERLGIEGTNLTDAEARQPSSGSMSRPSRSGSTAE